MLLFIFIGSRSVSGKMKYWIISKFSWYKIKTKMLTLIFKKAFGIQESRCVPPSLRTWAPRHRGAAGLRRQGRNADTH